jgi:hypothetical protein
MCVCARARSMHARTHARDVVVTIFTPVTGQIVVFWAVIPLSLINPLSPSGSYMYQMR